MLELVVGPPGASYRELIKEAFIDPIRTVVVVDDEYPTFDEMLPDPPFTPERREQARPLAEKKYSNVERVREILHFCRTQKPAPWLIDVHDGQTPNIQVDQETVGHLDHTDLLILDYHLAPDENGQLAIDILRRLAKNGHSNLAVVYTREKEGPGEGIDKTVNEIALSLAVPDKGVELSASELESFNQRFQDWEAADVDIHEKLGDSVDEVMLLSYLERDRPVWNKLKDLKEFAALAALMAKKPQTCHLGFNDILKVAMHRAQQRFRDRMAKESTGRVMLGRTDKGINWIRTASLFITVISKNRSAKEIPDCLLDALEAWDPSPHRLIMSVMRERLDAEGVLAEAKILDGRHLQAGWLSKFLQRDAEVRKTNVAINVARHWESLGAQIAPVVLHFAEKLASCLVAPQVDIEAIEKRFDRYGVGDEKDEIFLRLNLHACSKSVEGHHLLAGHILQVTFAEGQNELWLCLSPLCDLVPGQKSSKWKQRLGDWLPFKAIRLFPADKTALEFANRGSYLFVEIDGEPTILGFTESAKEKAPSVTSWEQFFVKHDGKFDSAKKLTVAAIGNDGDLAMRELPATIVAQIRYEYALNLMQVLGGHLSRVGLDFESYSKPAAKT